MERQNAKFSLETLIDLKMSRINFYLKEEDSSVSGYWKKQRNRDKKNTFFLSWQSDQLSRSHNPPCLKMAHSAFPLLSNKNLWRVIYMEGHSSVTSDCRGHES